MTPQWLKEAADGLPVASESPRVLVFDIETTPEANWTWGRYKQNVIKNLRPWYVLAAAYTWLGSGTYHFVGAWEGRHWRDDTGYGRVNANQDRLVVAMLWHLFDQADVIIAHNGDKFDIRKMNTRFMHYGLQPPSPYRTIDTLKEYRRHTNRTSNKLDDIAHDLTGNGKHKHTGISLWFDCMAGDLEAQEEMRLYNLRDVEALEEIYLQILPWIGTPGKANPGVNAAAFVDEVKCPKVGCGGTDLVARGAYTTAAGLRYHRFQCKQCHGWSRARYAERERLDTADRVR